MVTDSSVPSPEEAVGSTISPDSESSVDSLSGSPDSRPSLPEETVSLSPLAVVSIPEPPGTASTHV